MVSVEIDYTGDGVVDGYAVPNANGDFVYTLTPVTTSWRSNPQGHPIEKTLTPTVDVNFVCVRFDRGMSVYCRFTVTVVF
jgi:hypothetical protein